MHFFGYAKHPSKDSPVQFFDFKDQTKEDLEKFEMYKDLNEIVLKQTSENRPKEKWAVNHQRGE